MGGGGIPEMESVEKIDNYEAIIIVNVLGYGYSA